MTKFKQILNEKDMKDIDILDRLYSLNHKWSTYIEKFYDENYPDAEDMTVISPRDLKKLLRDIRDMATKDLENDDPYITDEEIKLLDIKITKKTIEAIYKHKLIRRTDYNIGWIDCYEMLKDNNLI